MPGRSDPATVAPSSAPHAHHHGEDPDRVRTPENLRQERKALRLLSLVLIPLALLTVIGLVSLWPSGPSTASVPGGLSDATFPEATVLSVETFPCPQSGVQPDVYGNQELVDCANAVVELTSGPEAGQTVSIQIPAEIFSGGVDVGDDLRLIRTLRPASDGAGYAFHDFSRTTPLTWLVIAFVLAVVAVARMRGLRALGGLVVAFGVVSQFLLPAVLQGKPPLLVGIVAASAIMLVVLYLSHGFSVRTTTALVGTLFGLLLTALIGWWATGAANLHGLGTDEGVRLGQALGPAAISGIVMCGIVIAGMGVLNDVTITQSSAVWELHEAAPHMSARELFGRGMRIGRDHIASTVYTLAFAYAGAALPTLLLVQLYQRSMSELIGTDAIAGELVRTMVGSIGLVLAIPVTTLVAVLVVKATGGRVKGRGGPSLTDQEAAPAQLHSNLT